MQKSSSDAYVWLSLAAAGLKGEDRKAAAKRLAVIAAGLTPAELSKAKKRAKQWRPRLEEKSGDMSEDTTEEPMNKGSETLVVNGLLVPPQTQPVVESHIFVGGLRPAKKQKDDPAP